MTPPMQAVPVFSSAQTGLQAHAFSPGPFTNNVLASKGLHYVTLFMLAHEAAGEPARLEPEKCAGWQWFAWSALPSPLFSPLASLPRRGSWVVSALRLNWPS